MVTQGDYTSDGINTARAVMLELHLILGEYSDHIGAVGGWVPELLIPQGKEPHIGSMDVGLSINYQSMPEYGYKTIQVSGK